MQQRWQRLVLAGASLAVLSCGCANLARKQAPAPRLTVLATLEEATLRPGEAVVCTVEVKNEGDAPAQAGSLCADTVEFWFGPAGTDLRYRREPVRSARETGFTPVTIPPKEAISRRFVLTRLTEEEGHFALHTLYSPGGTVPGKPGIAGPAFLYRVDGQRAFRRDENGLIRKEDAIEAVKQKVGGGVTNAAARLVRNEAGLLDWLVAAEATSGGQRVQRAFFVNPYTGVIRAEAKPEAGVPIAAKEETETSH